MSHISVLQNEVLSGLSPAIDKNSLIVDGTLGGGGHTKILAQKFPEVKIIAIDKDEGAIERAKDNLREFSNIKFVHGSFGNILKILESNPAELNAILLDIGFSSDQLEGSGRGFSFQVDEPLLMTLGTGDEKPEETAMDIVNLSSKDELVEILRNYGEESHAERIAKEIVVERKKSAIVTTKRLAEVVENAVGKFYKRIKINPATQTFQALRIAVNDELNELRKGIRNGFENLKSGGRMAVISFHSLEDRIVKQMFLELKNSEKGILITKKPIIRTREEILNNRRARSAKLRIIEKI